MKKGVVSLVLVATLLTMFSVTGCSITGSGNLVTEEMNFSGFNEIEAHNGFQLELTQSNTFSVEITADDNIWEYIDVDKDGDRLRIRLQPSKIYRSVDLRAKIGMPDLYKIDLSGGSHASINGFSSSHDLSINLSGGSRITGDITAGDADFDLSGGSRINLGGTVENLDVNGSGGSHLDLENFPVDNADINLSGGGSATVNVDGNLDVNLSGGSHVTYIGNPTLGDIDLSGGSEVKKK
jgi:hypothetical protein